MHEPKDTAPVKRYNMELSWCITNADGTPFAELSGKLHNLDYADVLLIEKAAMTGMEPLVAYGHSRVPA